MNIEEERKEFEATMVKIIADKAQALYGEAVSRAIVEESARKHIANLDEEESLFSVHFAMWLAAKEHAAEIKKPGCSLEPSGSVWKLRISWHPEGYTLFRKEKNARAWAKEHGYRVIE